MACSSRAASTSCGWGSGTTRASGSASTVSPRPIIAVVPFGARGTTSRAGAWARQIARRLVERRPPDDALELRPVFMVAMAEETRGQGYLIFGSTPTPDLAAQYGASLGATYVLAGTYTEDDAGRQIQLRLVEVATRHVVGEHVQSVAIGALHLLEDEIGTWLARAVHAPSWVDTMVPAIGNDEAYTAVLEAMDEEVNATLLRTSDAARADEALHDALARYLDAARSDPESSVPEERILVLAAQSLERGSVTHEMHALESLVQLRPRSWRVHYILAQLRAEAGDPNGAIVAFEHAHSLHPLPDADVVRLAELY